MINSKYRLKPKSSNFHFDEVKVQQRRWYGWRTVASFFREFDGLNKAKAYIKELEEL